MSTLYFCTVRSYSIDGLYFFPTIVKFLLFCLHACQSQVHAAWATTHEIPTRAAPMMKRSIENTNGAYVLACCLSTGRSMTGPGLVVLVLPSSCMSRSRSLGRCVFGRPGGRSTYLVALLLLFRVRCMVRWLARRMHRCTCTCSTARNKS